LPSEVAASLHFKFGIWFQEVLIEEIAEDLLARFDKVPLIDKYDVYQHLMTYWAETMQDDVYIVAQEGWAAARQVRELVKNAEGKFTETPDITIGRRKLKAELIPPVLIVARFFAKEQAALEALEAKAEEIARTVEEMDEEQGSEDGLLFEAKSEKGKLTAKSVKDRLKDIKGDKMADEERTALTACLKLIEQEKQASDAAKEAKITLDTKTVKQYAKLTDAEIKQLLVEDKWLATLHADVASELDRVSQGLTGRVKLLTERYTTPLPKLTTDVEMLSAKVDVHLKRMGFAWN
jgi:type I restriction enzyme M protein